ncbi:MAG: nucleoside monophosphate kinase, partial [Elusimicrobia bacterium]|nr:nucleoside monophosphate kinase [Elusimicrobiota bacterium]
ISSGDILREYAKKDPEVAAIMARGGLVPFPLVMRLMKERLSRDDARKNGFILDGFPRRLEDAIALLEILTELDMPLDAVLKLDVPEDALWRRLERRGRADDTEPVFRDRMRVYREQTEPVYAFLQGKVRFLTPDVSGDDPDAAYENVKKALAAVARR